MIVCVWSVPPPQQLGSLPKSFDPIVERVDAGDDHVLVYLKEVRLCTLSIFSSCYILVCGVCTLLFLHSVLQVPKGVPMTYSLLLKQILAVKNLKPAVISVYDYYQPSRLSS